MSTRALHVIILILLAVIIYLLFMPQQEVVAPEVVPEVAEPIGEAADTVEVTSEPTEAAPNPASRVATIEFSGILIGFGDDKDQFLGSYKTALINDGIEVIPVDLRPLVGYDVTSLETDLGVRVGDTVTVYGNMDGDAFVISDIE